MEHKFQINLRGVIDLLSEHLYSGPEVFARELLQNATDAIRARQRLDPAHVGAVAVEVHRAKGRPPTLVVQDDGVGLTPDEVHTFLSTIGLSSKRAAAGDPPTDFIGQFGIGILACFVVSDAIVVVSKSARGGSPAVEWRAKPDGTYTVKELDRDMAPGTQVWLTAKAGMEDRFDPAEVARLCRHYGGLLPYPVTVTSGPVTEVVNAGGAPWRRAYKSDKERRKALLAFGKEMFDADFLDAIPLRAAAGDVDGVAYVLPYAASIAGKRAHRVYLKNMLLSETADNLLPDWAFFVKAVVNANALRPTAGREAFYEDDDLDRARGELGECLRAYLADLAASDPRKMDRLIALHLVAIKALAAADDEFFRIVIDWLPFDTSQGRMAFGDYRRDHAVVRYAPTVDQFRQVARVAQAQGQTIIDAGHEYDVELLARAEALLGLAVEAVDAATMAHQFDDLTAAEQQAAGKFVAAAEAVLGPFGCTPDLKRYDPKELPALYTTTRDGRFYRALEQSKEVSGPLWAGVLDNLGKKPKGAPAGLSQLCFNYDNPLVRRLTTVADRAVLHRSIQMLYLQSMLLGHHPLNGREMRLLNDGLLALIEWGIGLQADGESPGERPA